MQLCNVMTHDQTFTAQVNEIETKMTTGEARTSPKLAHILSTAAFTAASRRMVSRSCIGVMMSKALSEREVDVSIYKGPLTC
jgi:hypothetical protein